MSNTLIITGAGASVDCLSSSLGRLVNRPSRQLSPEQRTMQHALKASLKVQPPLTRDLVDSLRPNGAGCSLLLTALDQRQIEDPERFDFEQTLRDLFDNKRNVLADQFLALRKTLAARMLEADKIGHKFETLYTELFSRLLTSSQTAENRRFLVLNLNYDRLAELAITNRVGFADLPSYVGEQQPFRLYQPHGSCNWRVRRLREIVPPNHFIRHDSEREMITIPVPGSSPGLPALALPMSGDSKGKTAWPSLHHHSLVAELPQVDQLIVVGWRGADEHIVELLARHTGIVKVAHLVSLDTASCAALETNLAGLMSSAEIHHVTGGFRNYIGAKDSPLRSLYPS